MFAHGTTFSIFALYVRDWISRNTKSNCVAFVFAYVLFMILWSPFSSILESLTLDIKLINLVTKTLMYGYNVNCF